MISGTCFASNGLFLACICVRLSLNTMAILLNLIIMIIILIVLSSLTDEYTFSLTYDDNGAPQVQCILVASTLHSLYSSSVTANQILLFMTFFIPWVHLSEAVQDIISVTAVSGHRYSFSSVTTSISLATNAINSNPFTAPGMQTPLGKMVASSVVYIVLCWFLGQVLSSEIGDGRDLVTVLVPKWLVRVVFGGSTAPLEGDIRGEERQISAADRSIRVYKCSKTYSGVQALKEVSFSVQRGECYCVLGHNGAGKSSLINILTGLTRPTHGKAFLAGFDVDEDVSQMRSK